MSAKNDGSGQKGKILASVVALLIGGAVAALPSHGGRDRGDRAAVAQSSMPRW